MGWLTTNIFIEIKFLTFTLSVLGKQYVTNVEHS